MTFQFRKRIKIAPGVSLNVGKQGVSVSAGPRGARVTVGKRKTTLNTGIPGTGLSHRQTLIDHRQAEPPPQDAPRKSPSWGNLAIALAVVFTAWLVLKLIGMR